MSTGELWVRLLEIIGVNIVLSGDNAVVIALAARSLPPAQQSRAILLGTVAAVVLRVVLTIAAAELLKLRWLQIAGSLMLLWIGIKLLNDDGPDEDGVAAAAGLGAAIRTILMADFVMSLDNVLGVAAAAHGSLLLLAAGLAISIPIIVFGSALILRVMDRLPFLVYVGAALIGYVAGEMLLSDPALAGWAPARDALIVHTVPVAAALLVVTAGYLLAARAARRKPARLVDLDGGPPR